MSAAPRVFVADLTLPRSAHGCELLNALGDPPLGSHARQASSVVSSSLFLQRTTRRSENLFPARDFQSALPRHRNPIILAAKAGIDPVGASYPKVICPP
jgi:hypothetical protein